MDESDCEGQISESEQEKEKARVKRVVKMAKGVILVKWSGLMSRVNTEGRIASGEGGRRRDKEKGMNMNC